MQPGERLGGRFEIEAIAGEGGMGTVYRAKDHETGRAVAVKVLSTGGADDRQRFDHEAQVVGALDHPNLVRYVAHGFTEGRAYLVLEWLEGEDLEERLAREPLSARDALRLGGILARALGFAHARGVVHRDVKPANIFLVRGRVESAKILDFGIALSMDAPRKMTKTGTAVGTPAYMAPEQARGERTTDARADVFSLGCVLFECFAGRAPFVASSVMAILTKVLFEDAPRLSELRQDVPTDLDHLVVRMMAKQASARPADCDEIARVLESIPPTSFIEISRARAPSEIPLEITGREQRLLAIVMVAPEPSRAKDDAPTVLVNSSQVPDDVGAMVSGFAARYSPLANGSAVAVLTSDGSATDLALRAARCALALKGLRPELPIALAIGRGLASGRVPAGEVIDRAAVLARRGMSTGDLGIAVDDLAAGLLDERFDVRGDERGLWLRGERETVFEVRRLLGKPSPCVGRARELALLDGTFAECEEEGVARGVLVTGAAGMGKSRVRYELLRRIQQRPVPPEIWIGAADPVAVGSPLGVLGSALRRALGLVDGEPLIARRRRVRARIARHVPEDRVSEVAEFVGEIVGVPFPDEASVQLQSARRDPTLMGDRMCRAFEDLTLAESSASPLVLVLEDMHWADGASVRLVEAAMRHCRERPLFVLALGRPEVVRLFPALGPSRGFAQVALSELPRRACEQLAMEVLGSSATEATCAAVVARAGGNAFYLEELLRHVADGRGEAMPETILAMMQARIEGLAPEARRILRAASVLGTTFWSGSISALTGGAARTVELRDWMPTLLDAELVERRPRSRFPGQDELVFRHALLRDAAYAMLPAGDRVIGHRLAGEWLEAAGETEPTVLGEHFERGLDGARAALWLARAAAQALDGHDVDSALALIERTRVADAGKGSDVARGQLALLEAEARRWKGELRHAERAANEAITLFRPGCAAWFRAIDEAMCASGRRGAYDLAIDWQERILGADCEPDARDARARALCSAGRQAFHAGGYEIADELIARVSSDLEHEPPKDPIVRADVHRLLGARARHRGDLAGDLESYHLALTEYEAAGDARNASNARVSVGFAHAEVGDYPTARAHLEAALIEAERMGLGVVATRAHQNLGLVLAAEGRLDEARLLEARVVEESRAQGNVRFEGWTRVYLARILLALGDAKAAHDEATHAATILEVTPPARAGALAVLALSCVALGRCDEAELHARGALVVLDTFGGIEEFESLVWLAAVESACGTGDVGLARQRLSRGLARLAERAAAILDPAMREGFQSRVEENARLLALRLDSDAPPAPSRRPSFQPVVPPGSLRAAYDASAFGLEATAVVERVQAHLARSFAGEGPVNRGAPAPDQLLARFDAEFPELPNAALLGPLLDEVVASSVHQHHPRYLGYQVSAPLPRALLFTLVAATLNSGMAAYDSGPAATALEKRVVDWMLGLFGWKSGGGVLTSGGSLGNLTALLAARQARAGFDVRETGLASGGPLAILCGDQVHYSIERAAQIMGLGRKSVIPLPSDAHYRLDPTSIAAAVRDLRARDVTPIALVASAGSTGVGAVDPLEAIADACAEHGLWMHVDGAHGASAILSSQHGPALAGIERADSIVWDAHKLMGMPALVTAVLVRDRHTAYATFAQRASYLYDERDDEPWHDIGLRTIECTKPLLSVPLYLSLATLGTRVFADLVDHGYALARRLASLLVAARDFELLCEPDSNIVCFRHVPADFDPGALDQHQRDLRKRMRAEGAFFIVLTTLGGVTWLRTSIMSPTTTEVDLCALLDAVRAAACDGAEITGSREDGKGGE